MEAAAWPAGGHRLALRHCYIRCLGWGLVNDPPLCSSRSRLAFLRTRGAAYAGGDAHRVHGDLEEAVSKRRFLWQALRRYLWTLWMVLYVYRSVEADE